MVQAKATDESAKIAGDDLIYRLKVTLAGTKPPVWRRLLLNGNERLDRVHMILNCAMGWTDTHLHAFEVCGTRYSVPDPAEPHDDKDERKVRLANLPLTAGSSFTYLYDFRDGWEHRVQVEESSRAILPCRRRAWPAGANVRRKISADPTGSGIS